VGVSDGRPYLAEAIRDGLRLEAIAADIAGDGDAALELLSVNTYDIAVLDRDIPGPSGDEIARHIVASGSGTPILMLTAADRLDDKASGFELGADDYLTKPFELRERALRLRALDRRRVHSMPPVREIAGLRLDPFRREVYRDGRYVALTRKQFAVLDVLIAAQAVSSAPRNSSNAPGTRTPIRSPTPCASPYRLYANASGSPGSSPPCPASATASPRRPTATAATEGTVARAGPALIRRTRPRRPGLSVRLKLTLSYAGFLMVAGILLLTAVWVYLLEYVPDDWDQRMLHQNPNRQLLAYTFAPAAATVLAALLVFGLLGEWVLAGRMLAPLTRITEATRTATHG
jgi:DNA-binding response OmpR family regulator